jgi:hypothetical protein
METSNGSSKPIQAPVSSKAKTVKGVTSDNPKKRPNAASYGPQRKGDRPTRAARRNPQKTVVKLDNQPAKSRLKVKKFRAKPDALDLEKWKEATYTFRPGFQLRGSLVFGGDMHSTLRPSAPPAPNNMNVEALASLTAMMVGSKKPFVRVANTRDTTQNQPFLWTLRRWLVAQVVTDYVAQSVKKYPGRPVEIHVLNCNSLLGVISIIATQTLANEKTEVPLTIVHYGFDRAQTVGSVAYKFIPIDIMSMEEGGDVMINGEIATLENQPKRAVIITEHAGAVNSAQHRLLTGAWRHLAAYDIGYRAPDGPTGSFGSIREMVFVRRSAIVGAYEDEQGKAQVRRLIGAEVQALGVNRLVSDMSQIRNVPLTTICSLSLGQRGASILYGAFFYRGSDDLTLWPHDVVNEEMGQSVLPHFDVEEKEKTVLETLLDKTPVDTGAGLWASMDETLPVPKFVAGAPLYGWEEQQDALEVEPEPTPQPALQITNLRFGANYDIVIAPPCAGKTFTVAEEPDLYVDGDSLTVFPGTQFWLDPVENQRVNENWAHDVENYFKKAQEEEVYRTVLMARNNFIFPIAERMKLRVGIFLPPLSVLLEHARLRRACEPDRITPSDQHIASSYHNYENLAKSFPSVYLLRKEKGKEEVATPVVAAIAFGDISGGGVGNTPLTLSVSSTEATPPSSPPSTVTSVDLPSEDRVVGVKKGGTYLQQVLKSSKVQPPPDQSKATPKKVAIPPPPPTVPPVVVPPHMAGQEGPFVPQRLWVRQQTGWVVSAPFTQWLLRLGFRAPVIKAVATASLAGLVCYMAPNRIKLHVLMAGGAFALHSKQNPELCTRAQLREEATLTEKDRDHLTTMVSFEIAKDPHLTESRLAALAARAGRTFANEGGAMALLPNILNLWPELEGDTRSNWRDQLNYVAIALLIAEGGYRLTAGVSEFASTILHKGRDLLSSLWSATPTFPTPHCAFASILVGPSNRVKLLPLVVKRPWLQVFNPLVMFCSPIYEELFKSLCALCVRPIFGEWADPLVGVGFAALECVMNSRVQGYSYVQILPIILHVYLGFQPTIRRRMLIHALWNNLLTVDAAVGVYQGHVEYLPLASIPDASKKMFMDGGYILREITSESLPGAGTCDSLLEWLSVWFRGVWNFVLSLPVLRGTGTHRFPASNAVLSHGVLQKGGVHLRLGDGFVPICTRSLPLPPIRETNVLVLKRPLENCTPSWPYRCCGPYLSSVIVYRFQGCEHNMRRALHTRMAGIPKAFPVDNEEVREQVDINVKEDFHAIHDVILVCVRRTQVLGLISPSTWTQRFPEVKADYLEDAWIHDSLEDFRYKCFVKAEKSVQLVEDMAATTFDENCVDSTDIKFDPRGISVPEPAVRVATGPWCDYLNRYLSQNCRDRIFYAPGNTPLQVSCWVSRVIAEMRAGRYSWALAVQGDDSLIFYMEGGVLKVLCADISRYDMSQRQSHFRATLALLDRMPIQPAPALVRRTIEQQASLGGDECVVYKMPFGSARVCGTMASGNGVTITFNTITLTQANVAILIKGLIADYENQMLRYGLAVTYMIGNFEDNPLQADFLQMRLWLNAAGDRVFGPKPGRIMARFFHTDRFYTYEEGYKCMAKTFALGLISLGNHIPIINDLCIRVLDLTKDLTPVKLRFGEIAELDAWRQGSYEKENVRTEHEMANFYGLESADIKCIRERIRIWEWDEPIDNTPYLRLVIGRIVSIDLA